MKDTTMYVEHYEQIYCNRQNANIHIEYKYLVYFQSYFFPILCTAWTKS